MKTNLKGRWKILIIFGVLFVTVCLLLIMIFNEGKKTYTVTFDLDGGILLGGSLEQRVTQGQNATPPSAAKDGAYLRGWSASHQHITSDITIKAIWDTETTVGIIYDEAKNQNFTAIVGSYPYLSGDVYLGSYYDNKKILSIGPEAFMGRTKIKSVHLLNGLISIGERAFAGCTQLKEITIPETVTNIEKDAFRDCKALEVLILNEGLTKIESGAFAGCTNLKAIILPESVISIESGAFEGCDNLVIKAKITEDAKPALWKKGWEGSAQVDWYVDPTLPELPGKNNDEFLTDEDGSVVTDENGEPITVPEDESSPETDKQGNPVETQSSEVTDGGK